MQDVAVARKYARALFEASRKKGNTERVDSDMESLLGLVEEDPGGTSGMAFRRVNVNARRRPIGSARIDGGADERDAPR